MQKLKFPMRVMNVTQGYGIDNNTYSHNGSCAIDIAGVDTGVSPVYAPCDVKVVRFYRGNGYNSVWFTNTCTVQTADGMVYQSGELVIQMLHCDDVNIAKLGIAEGKCFHQGEVCYYEGSGGNVTGNHVHLEIGNGYFTGTGWFKNREGVWQINSQLVPDEKFYITDEITIKNSCGYEWTIIDERVSAKFGLDVSYVQGALNFDEIKKAQFLIQRTTFGQKDTPDIGFEENIIGAYNKGMGIGFYHASYAKDVAAAKNEAENATSIIMPYKDKVSLPVFFDFEYFSSEYIKNTYGIETTKELVWALSEAYCETVKSKGFKTGVYANKDYYDRFYTDEFFALHPDYAFWYARPNVALPDKVCDLWQYEVDDGADYGYYAGAIDKNILYTDFRDDSGKLPELKTLAIGPMSDGDYRNFLNLANSLSVPAINIDGYIDTVIEENRVLKDKIDRAIEVLE